jgi:hypothetical protein
VFYFNSLKLAIPVERVFSTPWRASKENKKKFGLTSPIALDLLSTTEK